jgi:HSP20 family molecular chaperone IbpA
MQTHPNGTRDVDAALHDVARIYRSITGHDLPLGNTPHNRIPPGEDAGKVAKEALEQVAILLQRAAQTPNGMLRAVPQVDCWEAEGELLIVIDLPGVDKGSLHLRIEHGALHVSAQRERGGVEGARAAALERGAGLMERKIRLPEGITAEPLGAELSHGVLRVRLSRNEGVMASRAIAVS